MRFRVFGTEIYISFLFCAVISLMLATDKTGACLPTLLAALIHEFGHLFAMWIFECQPKSIRLVPASVSITGRFPKTRCGETVITICGPLANLGLFASLMINYKISHSEVSLSFALINLIIALFNLLPVNGLDGGTLLKLSVSKITGSAERGEKTVKIITVIIGTAVLCTAVILILNKKINISMLIVGIYILMCAFLRE